MLCSAACQPLFASLAGEALDTSRTFEVCGWVFRHEVSRDPARQVSFEQFELVHLGTEATTTEHLDLQLSSASSLLGSLGIEVSAVTASDPFFGRSGALRGDLQRSKEAKRELLGATGPAGTARALVSVNHHGQHFGRAFSIEGPDGHPVHSCCIGFGLERIVLALYFRYGCSTEQWPRAVRDLLELGRPAGLQ